MARFYIHHTGFTLCPNSCSDGELIYYLSMESSFFYELLDSYWTAIKSPTNFDDGFYTLNLMEY